MMKILLCTFYLIIIFCFLLYRFGKKADQFEGTHGSPRTPPFLFYAGVDDGFPSIHLKGGYGICTEGANNYSIIDGFHTGVDDRLL
jgi:hypothetical protein